MEHKDKELFFDAQLKVSNAAVNAVSSSVGICHEYVRGDVIADRYTVLEKIDGGGMSVLYKCADSNGAIVALKFLQSRLAGEERSLLRFHQEAKAIARLAHRNIIRVYEFALTEGTPYIVMDFITGKSIADLLLQEGSLEVRRSLKLMMQVADALEHSHAKGVVHRDLKPGNIMIVEDGGSELVKILDFGIAQVNEPKTVGIKMTQTGEVFGSPAYMSPEQSLGKKVDQRTDQYSLGCVMFECLTGCPPFVGENTVETLMRQIYEAAPSLKESSLGKTFEPEVEQLVARMLSKDPLQRFASMSEVKEAIAEAIAPPNKLRKAVRIARKADATALRIGALAGITAGVALCSLVIYATWVFRQSTTKPVVVHQTSIVQKVTPVAGELVDQSFIKRIHAYPNISELTVPEGVSSRGFSAISQLKNLQRLSVEDCSLIEDDDGPLHDGLVHLQDLPHLAQLSLAGTAVTDETLKHIQNLPLITLSLRHTKIDDGAMQYLVHIKTLKSLDLKHAYISDKGLKEMAQGLPNLKYLTLSNNCLLTDLGVPVLTTMKHLTQLSLDSNPKLGSCIEKMSSLQLEYLDLSDTAVRDSDLRYLLTMKQLNCLKLNKTAITDQSLTTLEKLPSLKWLFIEDTLINHAAVEKLKKDRPTTKIYETNNNKREMLDAITASDPESGR